MFDNYVYTENSLKNFESDGKIAGFEMQTLITYYRGIPLSMVHDVQVEVDGKLFEREKIRFSPDGEEFFTLDEMTTVYSYKWEYGQNATVRVLEEGGLSAGEHELKLTTAVKVAYIPVPFAGTKTVKAIVG